MLPPSTILGAILGMVLIAVVTPGPSFILVSRIAIGGSRKEGFAAALGVALAGTLFALLALLGVMALIAGFTWFYAAVRVFGGASLIYIAAHVWLKARDPIREGYSGQPCGSAGSSFTIAFLTHVSNPKVIAGYASIFAATLPPVIPHELFVSLPVGIFLVEVVWYAIVALVFSSPNVQSAYLGMKLWVDRSAGGFLACVGFDLIEDAVAGQS